MACGFISKSIRHLDGYTETARCHIIRSMLSWQAGSLETLINKHLALQGSNLQGISMYAPQGHPAVYFSVLASSVIIVAAGSGLLPPCIVPPLGLLQYHRRKRRNASCINYQVCARGVFRSQTARPVTIKRFPHFNSQGQKQGKTELFIAVDLREM